MSFKAPSGRFAGYGIFGSADDKLVLSVGEGQCATFLTYKTSHRLTYVL